MKVYHSIDSLSSSIKSVVTIGTFDGVHKGHNHILENLISIAKRKGLESLVLTFHPHPRHVLFPENQDLFLLDTIDEKIAKIDKMGIDHLVICRFDKEFSRIKSTQFIRDILIGKLNMEHMVVGYDHHFGQNRKGSFKELQELSLLYSFDLDKISAQEVCDISVSSTKIRNALLEGNLDKANMFLGDYYILSGTIIHGQKLGRKIGFPTANISMDKSKLIPSPGVYIVKVFIDNLDLFGMLNISFNSNKIEVHIFDFSEKIYGKNIQAKLLFRLRDEKVFGNLKELRIQLEKDEIDAKYYIRNKF